MQKDFTKQQINMETLPKQGIADKPFKLLKVTTTKGVTNYVPYNGQNLEFHQLTQRRLSPEKRDHYRIEIVTLTTEEAAALGVYEAIIRLNPPKPKRAQQSNDNSDVLKLLMEQNAKLMERLAVLESNNSPKTANK